MSQKSKYIKSSIPHCITCKETNLGKLMIHVHSKNGVHHVCRKCNTKRAKKYRQTDNGRRRVNAAVYKSIKRHPRKQNARCKLKYLVRIGKVSKPEKCEKCNKIKKLEGHHLNYNKPAEVVWLCRDCHRLTH